MGEPETPSDDRGFLAPVTSNVGGGVLMIGLVAALFVLIGTFGSTGDEPAEVAIDDLAATGSDGDDPDDPGDDDGGAPVSVDEGDDPEDAGADGDAGTDPVDEQDEGADDADEPADDPAPEGNDEAAAGDDGASDDATDDEAASDDAEAQDAIDPADVSVQVLDGYQQDGGTAADGVAGTLSDAGYRIVARNPAIRYDATTVLWTAGNQEAGEQVARAIGAAEVREQPGNLSTSVAVHVVVGADRG